MELNEDKCKVLHIGKSNREATYTINGVEIVKVNEEKDLGIILNSSLKWDSHINAITTKANLVWGQIRNAFRFIDKYTFKLLFTSLVRPHLEYGAVVWNPFLHKDIEAIESVQRRASKAVYDCRGMSYENRLSVIGLTSLKKRRDRGDLIQKFKLHKGLNNINWHSTPVESTHDYNTRQHNVINREISRLNIRYNFFTNRTANSWNSLPNEIQEAGNINIFKNYYDNIFILIITFIYTENLNYKR